MPRNLEIIYPLIQYNIEKSWRTQDLRDYLFEQSSNLQIYEAVSCGRQIKTSNWKL